MNFTNKIRDFAKKLIPAPRPVVKPPITAATLPSDNDPKPRFIRRRPAVRGAFRPARFPIDRKCFASGPRPDSWWKRVGFSHASLVAENGPPVIFTRPEPVVQRPVGDKTKDRNGWKRSVFGGITRDKKRTA